LRPRKTTTGCSLKVVEKIFEKYFKKDLEIKKAGLHLQPQIKIESLIKIIY
jgi:hypothetical protein